MRLISFHDWIRHIYATRDVELDCDQVAQVIAAYVDTMVAGQATRSFEAVEHHLKQCSYCMDLFLALRDVALLDSQVHAEAVLDPCETC